jgi:iron(III) transport system substrate-binding protein
MQSLLSPAKINFLPAHPKVAPDPDLAAVLKQAKIIEIDDRWAGENRKRIVERWVAEVLNAG